MTFNVAAIPSAQFIGAPVPFPSKLGTILKQIPRVWSLSFNWALYGVSNSLNQIAVPVNLAINNQSSQLDAIRGCYIDNTGSDAAVYVYFPDTGCIITCAQFSTNWQPVLTNLLQCVVIGKGFVTGDQSQTTVYLTNETLPPGESAELQLTYPQYQASPKISRGTNQYTAGFNIPAIGDQWQLINTVLTAATTTTPLFGSPYSGGGFITLTDLHIDITNTGGTGGIATGTLVIQSTGVSGALFGPVGPNPLGVIADMHGMQMKLNAAETWEMVSTISAGNANDRLNVFLGFQYAGAGGIETLFNLGTLAAPRTGSRGVAGTAFADFAGWQFTPSQSGSLLSVTALASNGNNNLTCCPSTMSLYADSAGSPGALLAASIPFTIGGTVNSFTNINWNFPQPLPQITSGTPMWIVWGSTSCPISTGVGTYATASNPPGGFLSGRANTIAGIVSGGSMNAGEIFIMQLNCEQP